MSAQPQQTGRYYPSAVVLRDPSLPHQIVISNVPNRAELYVSCNCRQQPPGGRRSGLYEPLEIRELWEPGEAQAVWDEHMRQVQP
jgi:hypothetical protein